MMWCSDTSWEIIFFFSLFAFSFLVPSTIVARRCFLLQFHIAPGQLLRNKCHWSVGLKALSTQSYPHQSISCSVAMCYCRGGDQMAWEKAKIFFTDFSPGLQWISLDLFSWHKSKEFQGWVWNRIWIVHSCCQDPLPRTPKLPMARDTPFPAPCLQRRMGKVL